ncbi:hypothetical protein CFC21_091119 [Triticum aestivum]|uniref:Cytochrome P450 n=2 Tax=Triticum aestivum TaxID=4565 RepID=A0A9R1LFR0_WHEAT|nr:cytochrome P450 76M5-like [Triticum aestivum]KAF7087963.1 hypothetical protein CFC21_091119 [Triticum aestivum]
MWFLALLACIAVTTLITIHMVHILHKHSRKRVSSPHPPGPAGHPILGNLLYVIGPLRNNPHTTLASLAQTYGPILSLRLGLTRTIVVVSSAAAAHEALAKNDTALASRLVPDTVRAMSYGTTSMVFLPSSNPLWKQDRAIMGAHFSSSRGLDTIRPILECHAGCLTEYLRACSRTGMPVIIREAVNRTVLNVISNILFSEDVVDLHAPGAQPFRGLVVPVLEEWSKSNVSDAFPWLAQIDHLLGSRRRISIHLAKLFNFFDQQIVQRQLARNGTSTNGSEKNNDVLDVLLARHAMSKLTRQEIITFLTDMFIAASDTSTVTVQWAMAQLLRHPEKMKNVRNELAACLGVTSSDFVKESDLDNLPYLHAVVKETLRLHPAVPLIPREVAADGVSLGGFPIPIGTGVVVNLWAIGRDPTVWPQPNKFVPERFLAAGAGETVHFQGKDGSIYRPFGAGRRVCPGMDYALRSVPLLLASLVHKTEWRLPDGMAPEDIDLKDRYGTVLNLATPLRAVPVSTV